MELVAFYFIGNERRVGPGILGTRTWAGSFNIQSKAVAEGSLTKNDTQPPVWAYGFRLYYDMAGLRVADTGY